MTERLTEQERRDLLGPLLSSGWQLIDGRDAISKTFKFRNFIDAMGWMTRAAIWSENWNHHPEWSNAYNHVTVTLSTHDVDGLSHLDIKLATKMDMLAE